MRAEPDALTHCAVERIEIPGCIQSFGGLLVCEPSSGRVVRYTQGALRLVGCPQALGKKLVELLPELQDPWNDAQLRPDLQPVRINAIACATGALDVVMHVPPGTGEWVVEVFRASDRHVAYQQESELSVRMYEAIERLRFAPSLDDFWLASSDLLRRALGYERVMIYRFDPDGSGQVIAESVAEGSAIRYKGLHFPASDIPAQARALYERNLLRVIADVDAEPDYLLGDTAAPLDQSLCLLRQPSPLHLQYLRNMGTRATLTVSLIQNGKLWGMLACHHSAPMAPPHHLSRGLLVACNLMGLTFNTHLESMLRTEKFRTEQVEFQALAKLTALLRASVDVASWWPTVEAFLKQQMPLERFDVCTEATADNIRHGLQLSNQPVTAHIHLAWNAAPKGTLTLKITKAAPSAGRVWAGDPKEHETMALANGAEVLGPRRSFQMWREAATSNPTDWTESEKSLLLKLEVVLHDLLQIRVVQDQNDRLKILGSALEQSREMVIVTTAAKDPRTGIRPIIYVNEALLLGTQYTRDELLGSSPSMFQGPQTDRTVVARISQKLASGESVSETLQNYKKDGTAHWLELRIHPMKDANGQLTHFVSVQRDVSEQRQTMARLRNHNEFLTRLTDLLPGAVYVYRRSPDCGYVFDFTTDAFQSLFGLTTRPPANKEVLGVIHPEDRAQIVDAIERSALTRSRWRQRFRACRRSDGRYRTLEGISDPIVDPDGTVVWFGIIFDVTDQVEVELALNNALIEHQATLDAVPEQLLEFDESGLILRAHIRDDKLLGMPLEMLLERRIVDVLPEEIAYPFSRAVAEALRNGVSSAHEITFEDQGRTEYRSLTVVQKHRNVHPGANAPTVLLLGSLSDITERKQAEERVRLLVNHDELTSLLNRRGFQERLQLIHDHAQRRQTAYVLMFIDLDHFKHLNDSLGHDAGDFALKEVADRLTAHTRSSDVVARLGGDEFVVLIAGPTTELLAQEALLLATKLTAAVSEPLNVSGTPFNLTCSIGIALSDSTNPNHDEILRWADLAMYTAKESGRNGIKFFDARVQQRMLYRVQLEQDLRLALTSDALGLHGQPIVDEQARVLGYEVLLRWNRPGTGSVSPADFIPVAEQSGLIVPMGQWVLSQACKTLATWAGDPSRSQLFIAVNVSAIQIKQADFVERVSRALAETGAPPRRLKLELTESLLHEDVSATIQKLHQLRALDVHLSLDDFGTGYSSLAYLRKLPIQELKIDRSFVLHALDQPDDAAVATMIVQLAQTLRLEVVAEGVETPEQLAFLLSIGCKKFQGYMFGRPALLESAI